MTYRCDALRRFLAAAMNRMAAVPVSEKNMKKLKNNENKLLKDNIEQQIETIMKPKK